jgi:large subunit ribosomal protein L30e
VNINEIRNLVEQGKVTIGTNKTIKMLKLGKISTVILAKNVPSEIEEDINYYSKLANAKVVKLDLFNDELGAALKKRFKVSVLGILKENE